MGWKVWVQEGKQIPSQEGTSLRGMELRSRHLKRGKTQKNSRLGFKPKGNFVKKGVPLKRSQPNGDVSGKPKGMCFNCNEVWHYSKDFPKPKLGNGGCKVIALTTNPTQNERKSFFFFKGKVFKREVLCFLNTWASHNFITRESVKRMEF